MSRHVGKSRRGAESDPLFSEIRLLAAEKGCRDPSCRLEQGLVGMASFQVDYGDAIREDRGSVKKRDSSSEEHGSLKRGEIPKELAYSMGRAPACQGSVLPCVVPFLRPETGIPGFCLRQRHETRSVAWFRGDPEFLWLPRRRFCSNRGPKPAPEEVNMPRKKVKYSKHIPALSVPLKRKTPRCGECEVMACWPREPGDILKGPANCPTKNYPDLVARAKEMDMNDPFHRQMQLMGARLECLSSQTPSGGAEITVKLTRVEELFMFCNMMGYRKIGIAHCIGCIGEAKILAEMLEARGFEVAQVNCKVGAIEKGEVGIPEEDKVRIHTFETLCNNVSQALILNEEKTDLNVILGLCLGHDISFTKLSNAPVTTLIVKDRRTGHNEGKGIRWR